MEAALERPGVRPVVIGEMLRRALAKLVTRAACNQAKTACGNLQLCAGVEAGIEGVTPAVGQRRLEGGKSETEQGIDRTGGRGGRDWGRVRLAT